MMRYYIETFDNVLPLETISSLIKYLNFAYEKKLFKDSEIGSREISQVNKNIRNVELIHLHRDSQRLTDVHYHNLLTNIILKYVHKYKEKHTQCTLNYIVNQIDCLRYGKGGHYKFHVDGGVGSERILSSILLLNNDYKGGDLCFFDPVQKEEIKIKVQPGRLIMWPSNFCFPHKVEPVTEGIRFSVVAWTS